MNQNHDLDRQVIDNLRGMLDEANMRSASLAALADLRAERIKQLEQDLARKNEDKTKEEDNA